MTLHPLARGLALLALSSGLSGCMLFRTRPPVYEPVVYPSGLVVQDLVRPDTPVVVQPGDRVTFHYEISLADGTVVDSSLERAQPLEIGVLPGEIELPGLAQGLLGMPVLGRRRLYVPAELAYGARGLPPRIPPDADLVIDIELLAVDEPDAP